MGVRGVVLWRDFPVCKLVKFITHGKKILMTLFISSRIHLYIVGGGIIPKDKNLF